MRRKNQENLAQIVLGVLLCIVLVGVSSHVGAKKVIFETDMTGDVDDVGALAVLHALADQGEAEILMISYNEVHPFGPAAIYAVNKWYGRNSLPIGQFEGHLNRPDKSRYLETVAGLSNTDSVTPVEATELYLKVLNEQPESSVTIISVGFLNNLENLLKTDAESVSRKVETLILMGGFRNDNFNFVRHELVESSQYVLENWPGRVIVVDAGEEVVTGSILAKSASLNPVRVAYERWFNGKLGDRPSWDQVAVLLGVRTHSDLFELQSTGNGRLRNGYTWSLKEGDRLYARPALTDEEMKSLIEELMFASPAQLEE